MSRLAAISSPWHNYTAVKRYKDMAGSGGYDGGHHERFGDVGAEISSFALYLTERLAGEPEPADSVSRDMPRSDYEALDALLSIEDLVPIMDIPFEVDGESRRSFYVTLQGLHAALPFDEAERGLLARLPYQRAEDLPAALNGLEGRIMAAGVNRILNGRDLMRRWVAWRRERDEFSGQGSLDQARGALRDLHELLGNQGV